jgi:hypothetical protein
MLFIKKPDIAILSRTILSVIVFCALFFAPLYAHAATLSISPASARTQIGRTVTVRVLVNSAGQSINAVSGQLTFSNDLLTLTGLSKAGIVNLWAQEPTYSNAAGTASFQGVILNGYTGGATVLVLTFKAKAEGTASVSFAATGDSVLLNDGQGTDVLTGTSGATITIGRAVTQPAPSPAPLPQPAPEVTPPVPSAPSSVQPVFTDYQSPIVPGNFIVVKGTASPSSTLNVTLTDTAPNGDTKVTQSILTVGEGGLFTYVSDEKVAQGHVYSLVATTQDGKHTDALQLSVKISFWIMIWIWIITIISIKISAALALLILLLITGYLLYRNHVLKKHLQEVLDRLHDLQQPK